MKWSLEMVFIVMIIVYVAQQNSPVIKQIPTWSTALTSNKSQMNIHNFILEENQTLAKIQPEKQKAHHFLSCKIMEREERMRVVVNQLCLQSQRRLCLEHLVRVVRWLRTA